MQPVSSSLFSLFASINPQYWKVIEGCEIVHRVWGNCIIEKVDIAQKILVIQGRRVALEYFRDDIFEGFCLPAEIVDKISQFSKQKEDGKKFVEKLRIEEERSRNLESQIRQIEYLNKLKAEKRKQAEIDRLSFEKTREQKEKSELLEELRISELIKEAVQKREKLISDFCSTRVIPGLVHFTRTNNLKRIIELGLLNREELSMWPESEWPIFTDLLRLDGHPDAICLSISFPNYQMFYKLNKNAQDDWVVLVLEPSVLWELNCAFCEMNAAATSVSRIPLIKRKAHESLAKMFSDRENISRDELNIPSYYTTNPQAEVLVFNTIPVEYIREVHFHSISAMNSWRMLNTHPNGLSLVASDCFFKPRCDWAEWTKSQEFLPEPPEFGDFIPEYY